VTYNEARTEILKHFLSEWGSTTAVAHDNEPFNVPTDGSSWLRLNIKHASNQPSSTLGAEGNRRYTRVGAVLVRIYIKNGIAVKNLDTLAQAVKEVFEGKRLTGGTVFDPARFYEVGIDPTGAWYQGNVSVGFEYEETR
jgi:hypothetical protein